jgi:hypothetical protein
MITSQRLKLSSEINIYYTTWTRLGPFITQMSTSASRCKELSFVAIAPYLIAEPTLAAARCSLCIS